MPLRDGEMVLGDDKTRVMERHRMQFLPLELFFWCCRQFDASSLAFPSLFFRDFWVSGFSLRHESPSPTELKPAYSHVQYALGPLWLIGSKYLSNNLG